MKPIVYSMIIFLIFLADRLAKLFIENKIRNYGAAFGILQGYNLLFILVAFALISIAIYYIATAKSKLLKISLSLIIAGTIGNLIDRLFYGYVIDVINTGIIPSFNISDLSNTIGAILLIVYLFKKE